MPAFALPSKHPALRHDSHADQADPGGNLWVTDYERCRVAREVVDAATYWHVELAGHEVILAEGLAAKSYLETGNRAAFAGADGGVVTAEWARETIP